MTSNLLNPEDHRKETFSYGYKGGTLTAGIVSGVLAGIGMALVAMLHSEIIGMGVFFPFRLMGATVFGVDALVGGLSVPITGGIIHFTVSAIYGFIFARLIRPQTSLHAALISGIFYATAIWGFMTYVVLPATNSTMNSRVALEPGWWYFNHMIFGVLLSLTPAVCRRFARKTKLYEIEEFREKGKVA